MSPPRVCMLLRNPCVNDSRVDREAATLAAAGYEVRIVATQAPGVPDTEERDGYRIDRVPAEPRSLKAARAVISRRRRSSAPDSEGGDDSGQTESHPQGLVGERAWVAVAGGGSDGDLPRRARTAALRSGLRLVLALRWWRFARTAWDSLRRDPADVYVAHDLDTLPLAALAKSRLGGRVVYDSHELYTEHSATPPPTKLWRLRWRAIERRLIHRADAVITVCQSIAEELAGRYRIALPRVVRNIPELVKREPSNGGALRQRLGIDPSKRIALYLGVVQLNRRLEHFIDAINPLGDVALVLMGPGDPAYVRHLRAYAEERGCADRVHLPGPVPPEEVAATARDADIGLVVLERTSLSVFYCLPSKLFESIHAEVPVVANDWPELRRIVEGYDVGVLCESEKPSAITAAIRRLLDDPEGYARMMANARSAREELNWQLESARLLEVFRAVAPVARSE